MTLVEATELSINSALTTGQVQLPRLVQLRIGDRLREALLTDMPAHEAVRAVAEEPFDHPVVMTMPWIFSVGLFTSVVLLLTSILIPEGRTGLLIAALSVPVATGLLWWLVWFWFVARPRTMLLRMAAQLERGEAGTLSGLGLLSGELNAVMSSNLSSQAKSTTIAELVPTITGMRLQSHQFAAQILGPLLAIAMLCIGIHVLLLTVIPQFAEIFSDFGVQLPWITLLVVNLSGSAAFLGVPGLICSIAVSIAVFGTIYALLVWPRTAEIWEAIPGLGLSVRWLMQARVARILGVLIRNQAPPAEAIAIASEASGFQSVAAAGNELASRYQRGIFDLPASRQLSGLPLSLLFRVSEGHSSEPARQETAQAFQSYASALEQASSGNGSFIALIFEMLIVLVAGFFVGFIVLSMFLPLIKLLNDLAVVAGWLI
jgi:hypothetical protein